MAVYEYDTPQGPVTASYQTLSANGSQGYFEKFMGDRGTLVLSERSDLTRLFPEWTAGPPIGWAQCVKNGYLTAQPEWMKLAERMSVEELASVLTISETPAPGDASNPVGGTPTFKPAIELRKLIHQPHLENFFDAIRGKAELNCPAQIGYETAVTVLKVNEAIEAGRRLEFKPEEFV